MRVAVVGSGVSGLVTAHGLRRDCDVTIFEADDRLGGHVHTWTVSDGAREFKVDTGFIVCNDRNDYLYTIFLSHLKRYVSIFIIPNSFLIPLRILFPTLIPASAAGFQQIVI